METKPSQPDNAIDKTLAALNAVTPPEGLENRIATGIAARLAAEPAPALPWPTLRWHDRLTGPTLTVAWWRGAATGAAFALLAVAAVLLLQHKAPPPNRIVAVKPPHAPAITAVRAVVPAIPCAQPAVVHLHTPTAPTTEITSSSHPIPSSPLTTQERELIRLAQTTDPKVLATFNSEHQAQLEAENAAQFERFFTPPPRPPAPRDSPAANPQPDSAATPEVTPSAAPETDLAVHN